MMTGERERRASVRAPERVAVALAGEDQEWSAHTQNISATGVYCVIGEFIPPMTKLALRFELPRGTGRVPIRCTGVVVRIEPIIASPEQGRYHLGIFFTDISERHRSAIAQFVAQRLAASPSSD